EIARRLDRGGADQKQNFGRLQHVHARDRVWEVERNDGVVFTQEIGELDQLAALPAADRDRDYPLSQRIQAEPQIFDDRLGALAGSLHELAQGRLRDRLGRIEVAVELDELRR